jgi:hypothetical protein
VSSAAPAVGTTALAVAVEAALELAIDDMPQTLEGVQKDVLEESKEEPEMVSEQVLEVVLEVVPMEGVMIIAHAVVPPPHGAAEASSPASRAAAATNSIASVVGEQEVVMEHPTFHALDNIPLDEAVSMAHRALSQAQHVLRQEDEDLADDCRRL